MTKKIKTKRIISLILSAVLLLSGGFIPNDNTVIYAKAAEGAVIVSSAEELPTSIEAGTIQNISVPSDGENPGPSPEPEAVDFSRLQAKVDEVKALNKDDYTVETWNAVQEALNNAETIISEETLDQKAVNSALDTLTRAVSALKKPLPTKAVALPADEIISITSVDDLSGIGTGEGKYYRLENDITIVFSDWYMPEGAFNGVFDGNGHKITFDGIPVGLFQEIGRDGIIQNVWFDGSIEGSSTGPAGNVNYGAIINCLSTVKGESSVGMVSRLADGVISNCVSVGQPKAGGLIGSYGGPNWADEDIPKYIGKIYNSYWVETSDKIEIPKEDLLDGAKALIDSEIKSKNIVNALNDKKGSNGIGWGQNGTTGYPYFGPDESYDDGSGQIDKLPENKYKVSFGKTKDEAEIIENQILNLSRNDLESASNSVIGQFFIEGVDSKDIEWSVYDVTDEAIDINKQTGTENNGKLHIFKDGEGIVKGNVKGEDAIWVKVVVSTKPIKDFKLFIDDKEVTNGSYTVEGSSWATIKVKAVHEGETEYSDIYSGVFEFKYDDNKMVHNEGTGTFKFNKPGTSKVTVTSKEDRSKKAEIKITSTFVPIESIEPDLSEVNYIHSRASMMDGKQFDAIETNGVIILPENASNKTGFNVTSSNEEVAKFSATLPLGYLPFKQGKTTLTASIVDTNPLTNESRTVTGTREVEFIYKNPLTKINVTDDKMSVKTDESTPLNISFEGEISNDGWSVTEPKLNWTYSTDGIVDITREKLHTQHRNEGGKVYPEGEAGYWIATTDYIVTGLKQGTVVATGTPEDNTHNIEPIEITIHVTKGDTVKTDVEKLAEKGRNAAGTSIKKSHENVGYSYGDEWDVYSLIRAGVSLTDEEINEYYQSIENTVKTWNNKTKPTDIERVMLALSAIKKDVKDVGGVNLEQLLLSNEHLNDGSNEIAYALIAFKVSGSEIDKEIEDKLISDLLTFQNKDGGFSLFANGASGVDTTAYAIQALALYNSSTAEINKGLDYIKTKLNVVNFDAGNSEALSQTILALTTLGLDPTKEAGFSNERKNVVTALMEYYIEGEGFAHTKNKMVVNKMATVQAFQALEAYRRFVEGEPSYFELQVEDFNPAPKPVPEEKPEKKPEQKPEKKPEQKPEEKPEKKPEKKPEEKPEEKPEKSPESKPGENQVYKEEQIKESKKESLKNKQQQAKKSTKKEKGTKEEIIDNQCTFTLSSGNEDIKYELKAVKADEDKLSKLNLKITKGSSKKEIEENIEKLAKEPFIFHFNTNADFDTDILVEMETDLVDDKYVLMHYNEKEEKLELVQKIDVVNGKTKFVVNKGGDYCITTKASTESLKDEENDSRAMTLYLPIILALAIGTAVPTTIIISKKTRKNKDIDEE